MHQRGTPKAGAVRLARRLKGTYRISLALLALAACGDNEAPCTVPAGVTVDWMHTVKCEADYELLWSNDQDSVFAHTATVLWLIDQEDGDKIYFADTRQYTLHFFFAARYLDFGPPHTAVGNHGDFNILNYRRPNRRFLLGSLVHYQDQGLATVEFAAGDTADAAMIEKAFAIVRAHVYDGKDLRYRPVSSEQEAMLPELSQHLPVVHTEDVFQGQTYQPLNRGVGFGTVRFRRLAELASRPVGPTDLVILDRVPNDIPLVSGLITQEFQTPLSHVNVLSKNRGTPNMALEGAFDDPALRALEGKLVRLEVTPQSYTAVPATRAEAETYWEALRPDHALVPVFDDATQGLIDVASVGVAESVRIGGKAANLGELYKIRVAGKPIALPDRPFAIPFYYYQQHITDNGLQPVIDALVTDAPTLQPDQLERRLFDLRWRIFQAPMAPATRALVVAELRARWPANGPMRFRSSTDVEDLEDFSGAGLYTSTGANLADGEQAVENAIKNTWASAWNFQAFVERDFYRVDNEQVRMAVLVHPGFPNELANGVAITINQFTQARPAFYLNSQLGEVSVTNPTSDTTPEQILYYTWYESPEYEIITRSALLDGRTDWPAGDSIFSDTELGQLAAYLGAIHDHFRALAPPDPQFAMDCEYRLGPGRQVIIKQARRLKHR